MKKYNTFESVVVQQIQLCQLGFHFLNAEVLFMHNRSQESERNIKYIHYSGAAMNPREPWQSH